MPSIGRMATSASFDRSTKRPTATLFSSSMMRDEQAVGLGRVLVGDEVVRLLEVDGVDLGEVDEVLDLDHAAGLRLERGELVVVEHARSGRSRARSPSRSGRWAPLRRSAPTPGGSRMREPVPASSWLKRTSCDRVADTRRTGTVTSPKLIEPVQMACGTAVSPISVAQAIGPTTFAGRGPSLQQAPRDARAPRRRWRWRAGACA